MDIWTAKAESGFTLARDSRSVERTKKFPWNVWMDSPAEQTHTAVTNNNNKRNSNSEYHEKSI